jgi:membrane associated rhomboid family serine protease
MVSALGVLRIAVLVAVGSGLGYLARVGTPGRWYERLSERFIYGVPWGSLVTVLGVVGFYLIAQSGLSHWESPVVLAFRSWSYLYPEGLLAAGFAHASSDHLLGNMIGTAVLAPIVEYAWSHYPPPRAAETSEFEHPPPGQSQPETTRPTANGLRHNPWIRALLIFPVAVTVVSIVTSVLAVGWSIGFSGTVFAFGGFAVIYFPVTTILAMVAFSGTGVIVRTLQQPVLRATAEPGAPGPPSWFGVNVQAHLLGFLIGVLLALALLAHRNERREPVRVFAATVVFGLTRQLWSIAISGGEGVFIQHRAIGVIFVFVLTVLITAIVAASDRPLPGLFADYQFVTSRRTLAYLWLGAVTLVAGVLWVQLVQSGIGLVGGALFVISLVILALPALPVAVPDGIVATPISHRQVLVFTLAAFALVVALPSFASNAPGMSEDPLADEERLTVGDYQITYAEGLPHGRIGGNESGLIVVSEPRGVWTTVTDKNQLARQGETSTVVGGFGWRETVEANRTGWELSRGDSAYVVDIEHDGTVRRSFTSDAETADLRIANHTIAVVPGTETFSLRASRDGETVGTTPIPARNETSEIGPIRFTTQLDGASRSVFAEQNGTRVLIATKEE